MMSYVTVDCAIKHKGGALAEVATWLHLMWTNHCFHTELFSQIEAAVLRRADYTERSGAELSWASCGACPLCLSLSCSTAKHQQQWTLFDLVETCYDYAANEFEPVCLYELEWVTAEEAASGSTEELIARRIYTC